MTLDEAIEAEIRRLYFAEHWCRGTIVAQLHVHPDAVERVLGRPGPKPSRDRLRAEVPGIDLLFARWVEAGRNVGSMTARTLGLLRLYGGQILARAVAEALERKTHDPGGLAILGERSRLDLSQPIPTPLEFGQHVPDRDVIPHDLGGYDE